MESNQNIMKYISDKLEAKFNLVSVLKMPKVKTDQSDFNQVMKHIQIISSIITL